MIFSSFFIIAFLLFNVINIGSGNSSIFSNVLIGDNSTFSSTNIGNGSASFYSGLIAGNATYNIDNIGNGKSSVYSGLSFTDFSNSTNTQQDNQIFSNITNIEGKFTSWHQIWNTTGFENFKNDVIPAWVDENNKILYIFNIEDSPTTTIYGFDLKNGTKLLGPLDVDQEPETPSPELKVGTSIFNKYFAAINEDGHKFNVYSKGKLLFSSPINNNVHYELQSVSPTGKYIILSDFTLGYLYVYEGS